MLKPHPSMPPSSPSSPSSAASLLANAHTVVVLSGAGLSAVLLRCTACNISSIGSSKTATIGSLYFSQQDSGIDTFRGNAGLWSGLMGRFALFYFGTPLGWRLTPGFAWSQYIQNFYLPIAQARPHDGHLAIAKFGEIKPNLSVITMNVDGLHQVCEAMSCFSFLRKKNKNFSCLWIYREPRKGFAPAPS